MMQWGLQIASLAVVLTIVLSHICSRRLPMLSTRFFSAYLLFALFHLCTECITLGTTPYMDTMPAALYRLGHQLDMGSLTLMIFSLFFYVDLRANAGRAYNRKRVLVQALPMLFALVMTVFAPLNYRMVGDAVHAYGPMSIGVYGVVAVYTIWTLGLVCRRRKLLAKRSMVTILSGIVVWGCIVLFQQFYFTSLLTTLATALLVVLTYLSFENPSEYTDVETDTLNRHAFSLRVRDLISRKRSFYLFNLVLVDAGQTQSSLGREEWLRMVSKVSDAFSEAGNAPVFYFGDSQMSMIITSRRKYQELRSKGRLTFTYEGSNHIDIHPKCFITVLSCPRDAETLEDVLSILNYVENDYRPVESGGEMIELGDQFIQKRNYISEVEKLVEQAVQEDGFEVFYQPIYSPQLQRYVSAEALVRLKDRETLGFVSPDVFIPLAEERGYVRELGGIVFEKVCRFASETQLWRYGIEYIEVNLSAIQCVDEKLPELLSECMKKYGVNPSFINLEITETASVQAGDMLENNMRRLRDMGCRFSMDDFGTGYSNLSQIAETRFELIKLDKSLIWPCFEEGRKQGDARVILSSCVDMISRLGMGIVAEGVETEAQVMLLSQLGIHYLQGYYFSKPVNEQEYLRFTIAHAGNRAFV